VKNKEGSLSMDLRWFVCAEFIAVTGLGT